MVVCVCVFACVCECVFVCEYVRGHVSIFISNLYFLPSYHICTAILVVVFFPNDGPQTGGRMDQLAWALMV